MTKNLSLSAIDHIVLTVKDIDRSVRFYSQCLGCNVIRFGDDRFAVQIGSSKINFHQSDSPVKPHAIKPTAGSAHFCLLSSLTPEAIESFLKTQNIEIELGPVSRNGARGPITSFYLRDPDSNLVEIATLQKTK